MKVRILPPIKYLRECFIYSPSTGKLFWRSRPAYHFPSVRAQKSWNVKFAGKEAFYTSPRGYRFGNLDGKYCVAHRVIWKLVTGKEPPLVIDHKDQNPKNNRWPNLRAATKAQNSINRKKSGHNSSGYPGVHKHKNKNRWVAQVGGGRRYVGIFDSPMKAAVARQKAAKALYGNFA